MQNPGGAEPDGDMLPEYDFSDAEVGKYAERYARAVLTVRLDPDVADAQDTSDERPVSERHSTRVSSSPRRSTR